MSGRENSYLVRNHSLISVNFIKYFEKAQKLKNFVNLGLSYVQEQGQLRKPESNMKLKGKQTRSTNVTLVFQKSPAYMNWY